MTSLITGRRTAWIFATLPVLMAILVIVLAGEGERRPTPTDTLPDGYDSTTGTELLERLPDGSSTSALVLFTSDSDVLSPQQIEVLNRSTQSLVAEAPADAGRSAQLVPSSDGTAALLAVPVPEGSATETAERVQTLRADADRAAPDGVSAQVTGPAAVEADLAAVFDGADANLLLATALVVAVLLIVTYRSPVLWVVPLAVVGIADRLSAVAATHLMAALDVAWDESTIGILSVLVFGAGTDYALLLISRYRDELRREESRYHAMARAVRRTAEAVMASAVTVVLGLLTLLLSVIPTTRGLGLACAVGIVVAAGFALVVLPSALVLFGRWVFWPRVPRVGDPASMESGTIWHRVGRRVARRPLTIAALATVFLAVLSLGLFRIELGLDQSEQFLDKPEAIAAAERVAESFPAGTADPAQVVTEREPEPVLAALQEASEVEGVTPGPAGDGISSFNVVLAGDPGEGDEAVEGLRETVWPLGAHVTGTAATALDAESAADRDLGLILPLILGLVLVGLVILLRSAVAPVLLVVTVVGTYVASMGLSWWVFTELLDFGAMDSGLPLLAFLFLVALGVDYNIFLVTRAREESLVHGPRDGMLRALAATGGVITSAGVLLAAVFLVLGVLPLVVLAQLGTVICIGVLLDTLLVRTLLVPALALLLGERFWWPRRVSTDSGQSGPSAAAAPAEAEVRQAAGGRYWV